MNAATHDTLRRALGLSIEETAALHGVQDRQVRRWNAGTALLPADAMARLVALRDRMHDTVNQLADKVATDVSAGTTVRLYRYRTQAEHAASPHASTLPFGAHAIMIGWAGEAVHEMGYEVEIVWAGGLEPVHP